MNQRYEIIPTKDGTFTILDKEYQATYHSLFGAFTESMHVYIHSGLQYFLEHFSNEKNEIRVLEMGLGSGMNAWLTKEVIKEFPSWNVFYTSVEKHPLPWEMAKTYIEKHAHLSNFHVWKNIMHDLLKEGCFKDENMEIKLIRGDILNSLNTATQEKYDVIYWDAFGPAQHPEAWTEKIFENLMPLLRKPCVLTTFCTQGNFKRMLKNFGFEITKLPGPPGKREILRAEYKI